MANKNRGSSFKEYLLETLKDDDQALLHIKNAIEEPDIKEKGDCAYLIEAIKDVATARGKGELAQNANLSRQDLYKILNGESVPSIQNIMTLLKPR